MMKGNACFPFVYFAPWRMRTASPWRGCPLPAGTLRTFPRPFGRGEVRRRLLWTAAPWKMKKTLSWCSYWACP